MTPQPDFSWLTNDPLYCVVNHLSKQSSERGAYDAKIAEILERQRLEDEQDTREEV